MAAPVIKLPMDHLRRRRPRRSWMPSLAITGFVLLVFAVLQNGHSIARTRRYLEEFHQKQHQHATQLRSSFSSGRSQWSLDRDDAYDPAKNKVGRSDDDQDGSMMVIDEANITPQELEQAIPPSLVVEGEPLKEEAQQPPEEEQPSTEFPLVAPAVQREALPVATPNIEQQRQLLVPNEEVPKEEVPKEEVHKDDSITLGDSGQNKHEKCGGWALAGQCITNAGYMLENCPKACTGQNKHEKCGGWALAGECITNAGYMLENCPKACEGQNKHEKCGGWALAGECITNAGYMLKNCPKACEGQNKHEKCGGWALAGECQTNSGYMLENCPKACSSFSTATQGTREAAHSQATFRDEELKEQVKHTGRQNDSKVNGASREAHAQAALEKEKIIDTGNKAQETQNPPALVDPPVNKQLVDTENKQQSVLLDPVAQDNQQPASQPVVETPTTAKIKCTPWEVNLDNWWQDHPDWEPSLENDTHACFSPIANPQKAEFFRQVHAQQFPVVLSLDHANKCSTKPGSSHKMAVRKIHNHGFAATMIQYINNAFWSAIRENRTFQWVHPDQAYRWPYVPVNQSSWAHCRALDPECYFLPLSSCDHPFPGQKEEMPKKKHIQGDSEKNLTLWEQNIWLNQFTMRPRHVLRKHFYEFLKHADIPKLETPCSFLHVRRSDAMTEKGYDRNFYPVSEYLKQGKIAKGESVLLLTDDQSAIEEATLLYPEYKWTYWNRTRNRGPSAYNSHFPSHDEALEVLILLAESKLASQCHKAVYGGSNMARFMRNAMVLKQGPNVTYVTIDKKLKKTRVSPEDFMKDLDAQLEAARRKQAGLPVDTMEKGLRQGPKDPPKKKTFWVSNKKEVEQVSKPTPIPVKLFHPVTNQASKDAPKTNLESHWVTNKKEFEQVPKLTPAKLFLPDQKGVDQVSKDAPRKNLESHWVTDKKEFEQIPKDRLEKKAAPSEKAIGLVPKDAPKKKTFWVSDKKKVEQVAPQKNLHHDNPETATMEQGMTLKCTPGSYCVPEKCSPWNISLDDWWQDHPDWEPSMENDTHTCFSPIAHKQKAEFFRQVHAIQFPEDTENGCIRESRNPQKIAVRKVANYGFASYLLHLLNEGFWSAFREGRIFQHAAPDENFRWLYVPEDKTSWAACPSRDHECYFLPTSSCPPPPAGSREEAPKKKFIHGELKNNDKLLEQYIWVSDYIMRPRQELRHHFYEFWKHSQIPELEAPCTFIHVRRGDAMTEKGYDRNYYPIQEYLKGGKIKDKSESILLLTDDQSAVEEATLLHPEYKWAYWNRTRNRGPTAFNSHIPSNDKVLEVLIILAERKLASRCHKGVWGKSNMARIMRNAAVLEHGSMEGLTFLEIDGKLKKTRVEPQDFMKDLDAKLADARRKQKMGAEGVPIPNNIPKQQSHWVADEGPKGASGEKSHPDKKGVHQAQKAAPKKKHQAPKATPFKKKVTHWVPDKKT